MTDSLDPAWAGIIGASIGAASAIIGGAVGPIVGGIMSRREKRSESDRAAREKLGLQVLDILRRTSASNPSMAMAELELLLPQIDLVDTRTEYSTIVQLAVPEQTMSGDFGRALALGYAQRLTLRWIRGKKLPTAQEFLEKSRVLRDAAGDVESEGPGVLGAS